ncbi:MAG: DUF692 domain-containing protein [Myxococcota bacterium]
MTAARMGLPFLGYGVGLRRAHFDRIFDEGQSIDFLEVLVENVMGFGGRPRDVTRRAAAQWPMVLHGVALSIGSVDPLSESYLDLYAALCEETGALWASDHLCFSSAFGVEYHDLVPLPFTDEAVAHVIARTRAVQARLPVPFALENPSYYIAYAQSRMTEAEFLREILEGADCGLLLDVNNVYVNAQNHGYDARAFIDALPLERVVQIHMAGHYNDGTVIIDTHGDHVIQAVLDLYAYTLERTGPVSTLLEWDNDIPPLEVLLAENDKVRAVGRQVLGEVTPWRP